MNPMKSRLIQYLVQPIVFSFLLASFSCGSDIMSYDTAPFPPTDVSARVESSTSIQITWSSVSNAKSYEVHCQNASLPLSKIATVSGTSYTHKDLKQDTAYTYSIRASNNAGTSDLSTPATATTTIRIPNSPTSVTLNLTTLNLTIGIPANLIATVQPPEAANKAVVWNSSDTSVAAVNNGVITPIAPGNTIITVTTVEGGKKATCRVSVRAGDAAYVPVSGVTLSSTSLNLTVSGSPVTLTPTINPGNATDKTVFWSSNNPAVATVNNGVISPVGGGTATITVTTQSGGKTANCQVTIPVPLPNAPSNIIASAASQSNIIITWSSVAGATGYYVYRSTSSSGAYTRIGTPSSASYTDTGLSANTTYFYRVSAYNNSGESAQSSSVSTTTSIAAPGAPSNVTATAASSSSISVNWSSVTGATGYYVYRSTSSSGTYSRVGTQGTTSYTDSGLSANTTYFYRVSAYNNSGESAQSSSASAVTSVALPNTPSNVSASSASSTSISVSWSSVSGATGYYVYRSSSSSGTYSRVRTQTSTSYTDSGLSANTTYFYRVSAYNNSGESAQSSSASATTSVTIPNAPSNVTAYATSSSSISVSWSSVTGATGYYVYRSSSSSGTYSRVGTQSSTSYTDSGLSANTTYFYKVSAYNNSGESAQSSSASSVTNASTTGGGIESVSGLSNKLNWLQTNVVSGGDYTLDIAANESIGPQTLSYSGRNVTVRIRGASSVRTISLSSNGSLFTVGSGVTLVLESNITLQGRSSNTNPLVTINTNGTLIMNSGSTITGNSSSSTTILGGGVNVAKNANFIMNGGTISGNTANHCGGVHIEGDAGTLNNSNDGIFTMNGGTISGNTGRTGGGVGVNGTFILNSGIISGNTSSNTDTIAGGGGVNVLGTFTMKGGTVSGNTSGGAGGGVYIAAFYGVVFTKTGGTIYGYAGETSSNRNTATQGINSNNYGHAVYVVSSSYHRETTAGPTVSMDSRISGAAGGWDN